MVKEKMSPELKEILHDQSIKKLVSIIQKQANKDTAFLISLKMEFLDKEEIEEMLYEEYSQIIDSKLYDSTRYTRVYMHAYKTLMNAVKELNKFTKLCKNKKMEADLLALIMEYVFENYSDEFGTYYTQFDNKVAITFQRWYNVVTKKLHPDYHVEYFEDMEKYYNILKRKCDHIDRVYGLEYVFK